MLQATLIMDDDAQVQCERSLIKTTLWIKDDTASGVMGHLPSCHRVNDDTGCSAILVLKFFIVLVFISFLPKSFLFLFSFYFLDQSF